MDTNKLIHFRTVFQTGNLREAAQLLNISHAGLSKSIKSLEEELGVELLTKDGRGIKVTKIGFKLIEEVGNIIQAEEKLKRVAKSIDIAEKTICRIGTFEVFSTYLAPHIRDSLPIDIKLNFTELLPGNIEKELLSGNIDYGISYLPVPSSKLDHLKVVTIKMGIFGVKSFQSTPISNLPFVIPVSSIDGTPTKAKGLDGWPDNLFPRKVEYKVSLMESALALTRRGYSVGYFPEFIAKQHNQIVNEQYRLHELLLPKKIKATQEVYLIKRKNLKDNKVGKKIAKLLRSLN